MAVGGSDSLKTVRFVVVASWEQGTVGLLRWSLECVLWVSCFYRREVGILYV